MVRKIKFRAWVKNDYDGHNLVDYMEDDASSFNDPFEDHENGDIILMQYTGLKDMNGVEIYEGDIVVIPRWGEQKRTIYYSAGMFKVSNGVDGFSLASTQGDLHCKIIGNIYENSELLNQ